MNNFLPSVRSVKRLRPRASRPARAAAAGDVAVGLSVIVPVFDMPEAALDDNLAALLRYRDECGRAAEIVIVDDGSRPSTAAVMERFAGREQDVALLRNERNRGKGYSVARGLAAARGTYRVFTDADLAYPAGEIENIVAALEAGHDVAIACRVLPDSRYLMSPAFFPYLYSRHVMSRVFNLMVRATLITGMLDSQAGLKGVTFEVADEVVPLMTISGFAFDVELLYAAHRRGFDIAQVPVFFRYDSEPTTMHFASDTVRMARDVARIGWNGLRGRYG